MLMFEQVHVMERVILGLGPGPKRGEVCSK